MTIKRSRVILTPGEDLPYKVVLEHPDGSCTEQPCATIREGETIIRDNSAPPPMRKIEKLREWSGEETVGAQDPADGSS
jgi:hypothetical protein